MKEAYFAGGCFWCITPVFREKAGVVSVTSGYSGGPEPNPTYEDVKHGKTHHRETIRVRFDPDKTDFATLLQTFLWNVDPFDGGGQFIDRGASYTLAVYYTDDEQRALTERALRSLEIETQRQPQIAVEPFQSFYPAEESHQDYDLKNPSAFLRELILSGRKQADGTKTE